MNAENSGGMRRPLLIENVYEKETTESFIERHFRESGVHRCRAHAEFDVDQIVSHYRESLIRSAKEVEADPEGKGFKALWTMLVFKKSESLFWHF